MKANAYMRAAFRLREEANEMREDPVDNATLPAGSPLYFRCDACHCDIIVQEGYLTRPKLCYDCRDLKDLGLLFEMPPPHTGWNLTRE